VFEEAVNIYGSFTPVITALPPINLGGNKTDKIIGDKSIFKIPLDDDTYNTNDENRYLYGITYYFNGGKP
jgi:hypothetical protein